jgi:hypothetical protein
MQDEQGRQSVAEAREKASRLASLVEGWVNAETAQRDRADRAESRVTALEAATRINEALIDDLTAEVECLKRGDTEGDRGTLLAKLYGARSAADDLVTRVTALEAALRDMCATAESHAAGKSDRAQVRHVVARCRELLDSRKES